MRWLSSPASTSRNTITKQPISGGRTGSLRIPGAPIEQEDIYVVMDRNYQKEYDLDEHYS